MSVIPAQLRMALKKQRRYAGLETQHELFEFLKHGDDKHQRWLQEAIWAFFEARPRPDER